MIGKYVVIYKLAVAIAVVTTTCLSVVNAFTAPAAQRWSIGPAQIVATKTVSGSQTRLFSTQPPPQPSSSSSPSTSTSATSTSSPATGAPAVQNNGASTSAVDSSIFDEDELELANDDSKPPTPDWELDCYSRPVVMPGGKKLWEVLITDSTGSFRYRKALPSNKVNSKELRIVVDNLIDRLTSEDLAQRPSTIRFFRGAMFNMINIALSEIDVVGRPSRCTFSLAQWLEERNREVYPKMEGFRPTMVGASTAPSFLSVRTPVKLPDALRGEKYAFVSLPLAEFRAGGGVNKDNIGVGKLCPVDPTLPADSFVQGVVVLTQRPKALAAWLAGTEVAGLSCDLRKRTLVMNTNIDTQYLMAKLNDVQRTEGAAFEEGKDRLNGLHFVCVQRDEEDDPAGFWLLREIPEGI